MTLSSKKLESLKKGTLVIRSAPIKIISDALTVLEKNNINNILLVTQKGFNLDKINNRCKISDTKMPDGMFSIKKAGFKFFKKIKRSGFKSLIIVYNNYSGSGYLNMKFFFILSGKKVYGLNRNLKLNYISITDLLCEFFFDIVCERFLFDLFAIFLLPVIYIGFIFEPIVLKTVNLFYSFGDKKNI